MNRLYWMRMLDIAHNEPDSIVLRVTTGDSEWIDCTDKKFRLVVKASPWEDAADDGNAIISVPGVFPCIGEDLDEENETGRIVFRLSAKDTDLNPTRTYYCRILETNIDNEVRTVFMGYFKVSNQGDKYQTKGAKNA